MSYQKANTILPSELIELIQTYIDGDYIYIPRKEENKKSWGSSTTIRMELDTRNSNIYKDFLSGMNVSACADKYFLSPKSIQGIVLKQKRHLQKNKSM